MILIDDVIYGERVLDFAKRLEKIKAPKWFIDSIITGDTPREEMEALMNMSNGKLKEYIELAILIKQKEINK